ncbi:MAG: hypothetical protein RSB34_10000 [Muribaculaceae bacterium]
MRSRFIKIGALFTLLMLSILVIWFMNRPKIVKIETLYHVLPLNLYVKTILDKKEKQGIVMFHNDSAFNNSKNIDYIVMEEYDGDGGIGANVSLIFNCPDKEIRIKSYCVRDMIGYNNNFFKLKGDIYSDDSVFYHNKKGNLKYPYIEVNLTFHFEYLYLKAYNDTAFYEIAPIYRKIITEK